MADLSKISNNNRTRLFESKDFGNYTVHGRSFSLYDPVNQLSQLGQREDALCMDPKPGRLNRRSQRNSEARGPILFQREPDEDGNRHHQESEPANGTPAPNGRVASDWAPAQAHQFQEVRYGVAGRLSCAQIRPNSATQTKGVFIQQKTKKIRPEKAINSASTKNSKTRFWCVVSVARAESAGTVERKSLFRHDRPNPETKRAAGVPRKLVEPADRGTLVRQPFSEETVLV